MRVRLEEKRVKVEQKDFKTQFGFRFKTDYRATVASLKKALEYFDDELPIGILYDGECAYCDIHEIIIENGLVKLVGD